MRLYLQLYLAFVAIAIGCVASVGCLAVMGRERTFNEDAQRFAELWAADLPRRGVQLETRVDELATFLEGDVMLWSAQGEVLAREGDEVPYGAPGGFRVRGGHGMRLALPDGRVLGVQTHFHPRRHLRFAITLGVLGLVVAVGCWPVARRLSRRLEALREGAERWGEGDLEARVAVTGRDEVARVAEAFNGAADRVQALVEGQRRLLAHASHELRSPLARLRMAFELMEPGPLVDGAVEEVEELDAIVGDVLRSARMEAMDGPTDPVSTSVRELVAAVDDTVEVRGVEVRGEGGELVGDERLLRRLVRNLVDNARRHGAPPVWVQITEEGFAVCDAGAALDPEEAERLFEPFYRREGHAEGVHGGVGLGLALVRQIARFHGGDVRYEGADDVSRFVVSLPSGSGSGSDSGSGRGRAPSRND